MKEEDKKPYLKKRVAELTEENMALSNTVRERDAQLRIIRKTVDSQKQKLFALVSECVRLRRLMEIMDERMNEAEKETANQKARAEKAERGVRNLQKWMEINGTGKYIL